MKKKRKKKRKRKKNIDKMERKKNMRNMKTKKYAIVFITRIALSNVTTFDGKLGGDIYDTKRQILQCTVSSVLFQLHSR